MKYRFVDWQEFEATGAMEGETVGVLTLNRPDRNNALGPRMAIELDAIFDDIRQTQVRVVVITGAAETFCSGGDPEEDSLRYEPSEDDLGGRGEYGELAQSMVNDHFHAIVQRALRKLEDLPQPSIAAIDGAAMGTGFELALACDLRIMTDRARVSEIVVPTGFVSDWSCPRNLPRLVGQTIANELILTGRSIGAAEAKDMGLVNRVVAHESLMEEAMTLASHIARMPHPGARYAKELIQLHKPDAGER